MHMICYVQRVDNKSYVLPRVMCVWDILYERSSALVGEL